MKKKIALVLLVLALTAYAATELLAPRIERESKNPGVVFMMNGCTAFVLKKGTFVTAGHCIDGKPINTLFPIVWIDGKEAFLSLRKVIYNPKKPDDDVAILRGDTRGLAPKFKVLPEVPEPGVLCAMFGYREGSERQLMSPCVSIARLHGAAVAAGVVIPGNSGSPIWTEDFALMGMVVRQAVDQPIFEYVPAFRIVGFADDAKAH